jgi:5-methylcytosine-specific restriction protein A
MLPIMEGRLSQRRLVMQLEIGETYRRSALHAHFGGSMQAGISSTAGGDVLLLFSYVAGKQHGYVDRELGDGTYLCSGEGQVGDMTFTRGNKTLRDHQESGRRLLLFREVKVPVMEFKGEYLLLRYHLNYANIVRQGNVRTAIVFHLAPIDHADAGPFGYQEDGEDVDIRNVVMDLSEAQLLQVALNGPSTE